MAEFAGSLVLTHLPQETRVAAAQYVSRSGNGDVLAAMGLDELIDTKVDSTENPTAGCDSDD